MSGLTLPWLLLIFSCMALLGLGFSGLLISRAQKRQAQLDLRVHTVLAPHRRTRSIEVSIFRRVRDTGDGSFTARMATLFGIDMQRLDQYPLRWWIVISITLAIAKVVQGVASSLIGPFGLIALPATWLFLSRFFFHWCINRRMEKLLMQFPDALSMIVRSVRVGIPVMEAIAAVGREVPEPTGPEFARLVNQVGIGVTLEDAIQDMAQRTGMPEYRFFATALGLQNQTGGGLSETLENLADVIRKRIALKARGVALSGEARASTMILAGLPFLAGGAMWFENPSYMSMLFDDPTGHTILAAALTSLGIGLLMARAMTQASLK
ncbi:MAG: type II secretion system F family protein [Rhodospirillales bacterium]|nr:type II secretion system F family protein [Rhodospirillales bacterium]